MSSHCDPRLILEARDGHRAIGLIGSHRFQLPLREADTGSQ